VEAVREDPALRAEGLSKSYASASGRLAVLDNVRLEIPRGGFLALLGPSGSGKSTLLNLLAGLEAPDRGFVEIAGAAPGAPPPIAYMQQKDLLLPWRTVWDNILLAPELRGGAERARAEPAAREWLRAFRLERFRDAYPAQLSGGMRQRVALIRTLLCEQPILLLDEPFGALDALTRRRLQAHLLNVWESLGKTVVLVTHDVEEALLLSTRIVLLCGQPGRIVEEIEIPLPHRVRAQSPESLKLKTRILERLAFEERGAEEGGDA
jgi:ABC-type nitrate/sulfonate/bicarbonate transport system ATPase subunit